MAEEIVEGYVSREEIGCMGASSFKFVNFI